MRYRLEIPGALYRRALDKAGDDQSLARLIVAYLTQYATGDSIQSRGGKATARQRTPEERSERARHAVTARWAKARSAT